MWRDHFDFVLNSASEILFPQRKHPVLDHISKIARILCSFCLSGLIHYCGVYMARGAISLSGAFLLFTFQGTRNTTHTESTLSGEASDFGA